MEPKAEKERKKKIKERRKGGKVEKEKKQNKMERINTSRCGLIPSGPGLAVII